MIEKVKIGGITYTLKSSVGTIKDYKRLFNKDFMQVISNFVNLQKEAQGLEKDEQTLFWLTKIGDLNEDVMQLAYTMITEAKMLGENQQFNYEYDDWIRTLDNIEIETFVGVLGIASSVFQR